ncbi:MAG: hypothetical protein WCG44_04745, partial [bacterium]
MWNKQKLYFVTIFLSSFLLFSIQPLIGKFLLPLYGGGGTIWTTAMFFFIFVFFLGNLYSLYLSKLKSQTQSTIHLTLISFALIVLLINFRALQVFYPSSPIFSILLTLSLSIGLPYFLLSTTNSYLESRYATAFPQHSPYSLYSLANLGSLLGLLSYPFIFELTMPLRTQQMTWIGLFILFSLCLIWIISNGSMSLLARNPKVMKPIHAPKPLILFAWLLLAGLPSLLMLSGTTYITQALTPLPLIWIIPLSLYLISYIIGFSHLNWYHRTSYYFVLLILILLTSFNLTNYPLIILTLFLASLIFHKELYLLKPNPSHLGLYYLVIAGSGLLASIFCSLAAPTIFKDIWEFPFALILSVILISLLQKKAQLIIGVIFAIIISYELISVFNYSPSSLLQQSRNFFGVTKVNETRTSQEVVRRDLFIGRIHQGFQIFDQGVEFEPSIYYGRNTGIGLAIDNSLPRSTKSPIRLGVVGLGIGTIAGYCTQNDYLRFYEIDPNIVDYSTKYFSYINHCRGIGGQVDFATGDARLSLQQELSSSGNQNYDLLIIDAFTGTTIPMHLLTAEAIRLYLSHLSPTGFVAVHITNLNFNLLHVLNAISEDLSLYSYFYQAPDTSWYFISDKPLTIPFNFTPSQSTNSHIKSWTDQSSSILPLFY